jgi:hypothetical protein
VSNTGYKCHEKINKRIDIIPVTPENPTAVYPKRGANGMIQETHSVWDVQGTYVTPQNVICMGVHLEHALQLERRKCCIVINKSHGRSKREHLPPTSSLLSMGSVVANGGRRDAGK